jgi:hypothetical protein
MRELQVLVGLVLAAVMLAALARRVGAPYPVFLALGGAILAFVPGAPSFTVLPELALALFVAPVLLDAAYDASPRDLRDNWAPVTGLVVFAVGFTTIAVAVVARALMPALPWAPAIVLGAVVAPPDAAAATAVLRQLRLPQRILTILEGESLLNDASALLIYRLAVGAEGGEVAGDGRAIPTMCDPRPSVHCTLVSAGAGAPTTAPANLDTTGDPRFNSPWSYAGLPAVTVPCALSPAGLPIGIQLVGPAHSDEQLLHTAAWCEDRLNFQSFPGDSAE